MQERQRAISDWMISVMDRREISARAWAEKAGLGKDTVSRAIREDYQHVTSTTTIAKLAEAVGERPPGLAGAIPSEGVLAGVLDMILQSIPGGTQLDQVTTQALAGALRETLLHLADEPEAGADPKVSLALARASVRQRQQAGAQ